MTATNIETIARSLKASRSKSHSAKRGLNQPTASGNDLLMNAEALLQILRYVEEQAEIHKFRELVHFVGTARLAATDLVKALNEK